MGIWTRPMFAVVACVATAASTVVAQPTLPEPASPSPASATAPPAAESPSTAPLTVPAMTPLVLKLVDPLSSNISRPGDRFRIVVGEDVSIDGSVVIPAGTEGEGEVIHAARSGAGGKAGELLLTGRFIRVGAQVVRLRSFVIGGTD